jgi:hypothetical protein
VLVTARLLRSSASLQWLTFALTVLGATALVRGTARPAATTVLVLGFVAIYYGMRVAFDARLFDDIVRQRLTTEDLDGVLETFGRPATETTRSWTDRCRGARKLVMTLSATTIVQIAAVIWLGWS